MIPVLSLALINAGGVPTAEHEALIGKYRAVRQTGVAKSNSPIHGKLATKDNLSQGSPIQWCNHGA
jgi:hypothetical protein